MGTLVITNSTSADLPVPGLVTIRAGITKTFENRSYADYMRLGPVALTALGLTHTWTPASGEAAYLLPPNSLGALDFGEVASTDLLSPGSLLIRKAFTALVTGAADDVTIYAVNTLPFKMRFVRAYVKVTAEVASSTLTARSVAGGSGGTLIATFSSASKGIINPNDSTPLDEVVTPGSSVGLFLRRSDRAVAGVAYFEVRRES